MFKKKNADDQHTLQDAIDSAYEELHTLMADSDEYATVLDKIERLHKLQALQKSRNTVDANTIALIGANLIGLVIVLNYEQAHVAASKALSMIIKPKI